MTARRPLLAWVLPVVIAVAAVVAVGVAATRGPDGSGTVATSARATTVPPIAVAATDAVTYRTVDELAGASDLVVRGRVAEVRRGRVVGEPGAGIESRVVVVDVAEVLRTGSGASTTGTTVAGPTRLLVEEEGWLDDGTPIAVNGVPPLQVGDEAVWFLLSATDGALPAYITVNSQGRFQLLPDGRLRGGAPTDPLVRTTEAAGAASLLSALHG